MNIVEWIVSEKLAQNNFAAAHVATGLKLFGLDEEEQKRRVRMYRRFRKATKDTPEKCYQYVLEGKEPPEELFADDSDKFYKWVDKDNRFVTDKPEGS